MIYLQQDKKRGARKKTAFRLFLLAIVLYVVYFIFSNIIAQGLHSLQKGSAYMLGFYDNPIRPVSENAYITALESDNASLKELLGRKPEKYDKELAVILSYPPRTPYDSLIIDIGEDHGLIQGDLVYANMDYLMGRIEKVYSGTSIVKLFSSPGEKVEALVGSSTTPVLVEGRGGGNFYIKVPRNITVNEGDPIIIPSLHNLLLGSAERVDAGEGEAYTYIYFKTPVNFNSLRYVQIKKTIR